MTDIDDLLLNAALRNELERYCDEAIEVIDPHRMSTHTENEYLTSMLEWECAPALPISQWFDPELSLPAHQDLGDQELKERLEQTLRQLRDCNIVLEYTDHLSDRQLYCLIVRDILPEREKRLPHPRRYLLWQCIDPLVDEENWLRFYADPNERRRWQLETGLPLPPAEQPPFPRPVFDRRPG
jgi:hypothetical protein